LHFSSDFAWHFASEIVSARSRIVDCAFALVTGEPFGIWSVIRGSATGIFGKSTNAARTTEARGPLFVTATFNSLSSHDWIETCVSDLPKSTFVTCGTIVEITAKSARRSVSVVCVTVIHCHFFQELHFVHFCASLGIG